MLQLQLCTWASWNECWAKVVVATSNESFLVHCNIISFFCLYVCMFCIVLQTAADVIKNGLLTWFFYVGGCRVYLSRPSREELDAITMNPIRMTTDLKWLESHVRTVCGGQLPPLVGPYAIPFLVSQLEGMQRHFTDGFTGWSSVLSTVTDAVPQCTAIWLVLKFKNIIMLTLASWAGSQPKMTGKRPVFMSVTVDPAILWTFSQFRVHVQLLLNSAAVYGDRMVLNSVLIHWHRLSTLLWL